MKVRVQVVIETEASDSGDVQDIMEIEREGLLPETVGLTLEEAKTALERIQRQIVEQQVTEYLQTQSRCPHCGNKRSHKGDHTVTIRTLFGKLKLPSPRFYHCPCQPHPTHRPSVPWQSGYRSAALPGGDGQADYDRPDEQGS